MTHRKILSVLLLAGTAFAGAPASAQNAGAMESQGENWDTIKQLPDFGDIWMAANIGPGGQTFKEPMSLTPPWAAKVEELKQIRAKSGDVEGRAKYCIVLGFPGGMAGPEEIHEFLYTPGQVTMTDVQGYVRRVYTDGRKHHIGPPSFWGDSVGHWEGNTLVVDTINLQHGNEISYGLAGGTNMHVTECIHLKDGDPDTMEIDTVVQAPDAFTKPFAFTTAYKRHKDWQMTEWDCAQNNRDLDNGGKQQMNLTAPEDGPVTAPLMPNRGRGSRKDQG